MDKTPFQIVFRRGESREIYGARKINFIVLCTILFLTFVALGGANIGLYQLSMRMNDPFLNWLSMEVYSGKSHDIEDLKFRYNNPESKEFFGHENISSHGEFFIRALTKDTLTKALKGISMDIRNPILKAVFSQDNLEVGEPAYVAEHEVGLIVTRNVLSELGYAESEFPTHLEMRFDDSNVPIPIKAIVQELPEKNDFFSTSYFYYNRTHNREGFKRHHNLSLMLFVPDRAETELEISKKVRNYLGREYSSPELKLKELKPYLDTDAHALGRTWSFSWVDTAFSVSKLDIIYSEMLKDSSIAPIASKFTRSYKYELEDPPADDSYLSDKIYVSFKPEHLGNVRQLSDSLFLTDNMEIDMTKIRDKENFLRMATLTRNISFGILAFALVSVAIFLYNILRNHLHKISRNIGNFQALGLANKMLRRIYLSLLSKFIGSAILLSLILSSVTLSAISWMVLGADIDSFYFPLYNPNTLLGIGLPCLISYCIYQYLINAIFKRSPGDLIYRRPFRKVKIHKLNKMDAINVNTST